ncbi:pgm [Wigglesworthia glossinidia endosymbiont of Glossina brevipalpis]|uniref:Pgm protein n=1 Tax=Wigglesworthia glossinidia brevipalpis TaxID=36870 RepID=Q8D2C9_WIGBR|nr:pgm [Wigglesworthia glossinidia endosymbiont of Glossina brevipalpis]
MKNNNYRAGKKAEKSDLIDANEIIQKYYHITPKSGNNHNSIKFGTSGHRGESTKCTFNELHVLAISQAIVEQRKILGINGPCFVGRDTHALSDPAFNSVLEVLIANNIDVIIQSNNYYVPSPIISHAIINHNKKFISKSDGIIITSSHNPPQYGGIKYNSCNGGPANYKITKYIEEIANLILFKNLSKIKRVSLFRSKQKGNIYNRDITYKYVNDIYKVVDMESIKNSNIKLAIDPLGSSGILCWQLIEDIYKLNLTILNKNIDNTFYFLCLDYDGTIRMDCSSKPVLTNLLKLSKNFDLSFANDPDCDRHCIIESNKIIYPNHYLSVASHYLFKNRNNWNKSIGLGKTYVSSKMINSISNHLNKKLIQTPVGFKWFVDFLFYRNLGFCLEESSGATFLCSNGNTWSTDKDGIIMCLLSAEIVTNTKKRINIYYKNLENAFGCFYYKRFQYIIKEKNLGINYKINIRKIKHCILTDDKIIYYMFNINNILVEFINGWIAIRPSGTENFYRIYCESFIDDTHLKKLQKSAINIINIMLK